MHMKILLFSIFTLFVQYELVAQNSNTKDSTINNGWQITFSPTLSYKESIRPNYPNSLELSVYSKHTLGLNFNFSRNFNINSYSFFNIGGILGTYKADIGYDLSEKLLDSIKLTNYYDNSGLTFQLSVFSKYYYKILKINKTDLFANVGLGANYFAAAFYSFETNDMAMKGLFNENRKSFLFVTIGVSLRHQISDRLYLISGLNYAYSPAITFKGRYEIYTKSNTVSGNIEKRFSVLNFDVGFFRSFTSIPLISKKALKYKKEVKILDFYAKGWGLSFTPYIVPKFIVNQNPTSQTTIVYSKPRLSYKAELNNLTPLSNKAFLKTSLSYGGFRTDEGLNIDQAESITGKPIDIYEKYNEGMRYFALSTQLGHLLMSNEYQALTISAGASLNRIIPAGWGDNRTAIDEKDSRLNSWEGCRGGSMKMGTTNPEAAFRWFERKSFRTIRI